MVVDPAAARLLRAAVLLLCLFARDAAAQIGPDVDPAIVQSGREIISALRSGDSAGIEARFNDRMRGAVPHDRFVSMLEQIRGQFGNLKQCGEPAGTTRDGLRVVAYRCEFDNATLTLRLAWNDQHQLAGMFIVPPRPDQAAGAPLPDGSREEPITTGAKGWPLPGTMTIPARAPQDLPRAPIVVLIHGSGPNDRDETIGANKPFRDLTVGLARHGIATLRYDKRTEALGPRFVDEVKNPTMDDEIVDDAVAAMVQAAARRDVGPLFIVGHSQGAWLAPRIADGATKRGVHVAGIVMLASPITPFEDLIVDQYAFLTQMKSRGATDEMLQEMKNRRDNVKKLVAQHGVGSADPTATTAVDALPLPLNLPASLWLDLARYDPAAALAAQPDLPALLTFGGRDFQVPIREKDLWEAKLAGRANATIVAFPAMNHLLIDGSGPMSPSEYNQPGHASDALIDRVSGWIVEHAKTR
jgi:uncharacterized protein